MRPMDHPTHIAFNLTRLQVQEWLEFSVDFLLSVIEVW